MGKAVLLDIDGTMIDSNDQHAWSWVEALRTENIEVPFEKIRKLIGMGGDRLLPAVTSIQEESEQGRRIAEARMKIFKEKYLDQLQPFAGIRELLRKMQSAGFALSVATSSDKALMKDLLKKANVYDLIEEAISKDQAESSKPAPDIIEASVEIIGTKPDQAIMLGDTPYDIVAATRAGVRTVAFTCGGWTADELAGAIAVYSDPQDLLNNFDRSPFASPSPALSASL